MAKEPCIGCAEETAVGSVFYSDRRVIDHGDGWRTYLCTLCDARIRSSHQGKRLTDEEARRIIESSSRAAIAWSGGGPAGHG